jgi:RND family efflux transporter MFP subunit
MSIAREQPRTRNNSLWIGAVIAALLLIGFGAWAFMRTRPESATVSKRDLIAVVPVKGDVVAPPTERADLYSPFKAPVAKVYATVGANVKRGDVLVELNVPNAQQAYADARARVQEAETAYANAAREYDAPISAAKKELDAARAAERSARQPVTTTPSVTVDSATGTTTTTTTTTSPAPAADLQTASSARIAAEQALAQAQATKTTALAVYQQQLDSAREYLKEAQSGRKIGMIRSPINGTVLALNAQAGAMAGTDRKVPLATVVDLDELEVQGVIDPRQASAVKAGMPVSVTVVEVPNEQFEGRVHAITTRTGGGLLKNKMEYVAVVHLKNKGGQVKPGMKAGAAVKLDEQKNVLAVPNDAVHEDSGGRPVVKVLTGSNWTDRVVEIGLSDGHYTEVKSGLKEGEVVQVKQDLL